MPHISEMSSSRYLKVADVREGPMTVTVRDCVKENVAQKNQPQEQKWVLKFHEIEQGLVLGETNRGLMVIATGSEYSEEWIGKRIVLYNDSTVMLGRERTGGVRVRAEGSPVQIQSPPRRPAPSPAPPLQEQHRPNPEYDGGEQTLPDDEIPF